jgi:hypothetical protein
MLSWTAGYGVTPWWAWLVEKILDKRGVEPPLFFWHTLLFVCAVLFLWEKTRRVVMDSRRGYVWRAVFGGA